MDLIDKQDRFLSIHALIVFCRGNHFLHVFLARRSRIDLHELCTCGIGNHFRQRRLSRTRRSVKDDGAEFIRFDRTVQQFVFPDDVLLPDNLIKCGRTQP